MSGLSGVQREEPPVLVEIRGRVGVILLNRPERRNAIDAPMALALAEAVMKLDESAEVDSMVLSGRGEHFCAGADLKAFGGEHMNQVDPEGNGPLGPTRFVTRKPTLAAIEGYAVAGGLELSLWCDLRVASSTATFGVFCRRFGVPLIDGGTIRLPRLIGQSRALDLILTGRPVAAEEALQIGLVNRVAPAGASLEHAITLAEQLGQFPQGCLLADRASVYAQWDMSLEAALQQETIEGLKVLRSDETARAVSGFTQGAGRHGKFPTGNG